MEPVITLYFYNVHDQVWVFDFKMMKYKTLKGLVGEKNTYKS